MNRLPAAALALLVTVASARSARAADCAADADRLRAHLETATPGVQRWQLAWTIAFSAAAAGQFALALAEYKPFGDFDKAYEETLYVGGTKATIGILSRLVFPLRVHVPARDPDRCAELAALRDEITRLGKKERQSFWLTHIGGTSLNLAGMFFLWSRNDFKTGAVSFAISYPVGITSAYTLPRRTWHLWREERAAWSVGIAPGRDASGARTTLLVLGGTW